MPRTQIHIDPKQTSVQTPSLAELGNNGSRRACANHNAIVGVNENKNGHKIVTFRQEVLRFKLGTYNIIL